MLSMLQNNEAHLLIYGKLFDLANLNKNSESETQMKTIDSSLDSLLKRNRCICDKSLFVFYVFFFLPCYCLLLFTTSDYISKIFNIFILVQMSISHTNGGTNERIEKEHKHM